MRAASTIAGSLLAVLATQLAPGSTYGETDAGTSPPGGRVQSARQNVATFAGAIDTTKRAAVARAYHRRLASNLSTPIGWTGKNSTCRAGHPSARAQAATLESLNFVRAMARLAPVTLKRTLSSRAQKAALIMSANQSLSHDPPHSWKCWTRIGANAAGNSNLALSWPRITAGGLVKQYMDDSGSGNTAAGHRRWILNPPTVAMGSGTTSTANALWVFGPMRSSRPNPNWVAWPTAGWFPAPLQPGGRWSLSAGDDSTDFSDSHVVVKRVGGGRLGVSVHAPADGYGNNTLVWEVHGLRSKAIYKVTVRGIRQAGRPSAFAHTYQVHLFLPSG